MPSLEFLQAGLMTSVQDMGRQGLAYYAFPSSGVMDKKSAMLALLLLDKEIHEPLIECTSIAPKIKFQSTTRLALTGANFGWRINGKKVRRNAAIVVQEGAILEGESANKGLRAYIAIDGDLQLQKSFSSFSTYTPASMGGVEGRMIKKGDVIFWTKKLKQRLQAHNIIPIQKGPEYDMLDESSKGLLCSSAFKISQDSNRMGARLFGEKLKSKLAQLEYSLPVLPGFIQLLPSGDLVVILQDGQVSGGYPRVAYIKEKDLSDFNQIALGSFLYFDL